MQNGICSPTGRRACEYVTGIEVAKYRNTRKGLKWEKVHYHPPARHNPGRLPVRRYDPRWTQHRLLHSPAHPQQARPRSRTHHRGLHSYCCRSPHRTHHPIHRTNRIPENIAVVVLCCDYHIIILEFISMGIWWRGGCRRVEVFMLDSRSTGRVIDSAHIWIHCDYHIIIP